MRTHRRIGRPASRRICRQRQLVARRQRHKVRRDRLVPVHRHRRRRRVGVGHVARPVIELVSRSGRGRDGDDFILWIGVRTHRRIGRPAFRRICRQRQRIEHGLDVERGHV